MTSIRHTVKRKTEQTFRHTGRQIIVSIEPGDLISMRLKGMRTTYRSTIENVFIHLAELYARMEKIERRARRQRRKEAAEQAAA